MEDQERDEKIARITNPDKSKKARQGHKKYGANYRKGIRARERDERNPSLRDILKELKEALEGIETQ